MPVSANKLRRDASETAQLAEAAEVATRVYVEFERSLRVYLELSDQITAWSAGVAALLEGVGLETQRAIDRLAPALGSAGSNVHRAGEQLPPGLIAAGDLLARVNVTVTDAAGFDQIFASLARLTAPDVSRIFEEALSRSTARNVWQPDWPALAEADDDDAVDELLAEEGPSAELQTAMNQAIMARLGKRSQTETDLVHLVVFIALRTGAWLPAIFFVLDMLRQRAAAEQRSLVISEDGRDFTVEIEWDPDGAAWVTRAPELNGLSTYGTTRNEALARTREAIQGYVIVAERRGLPLPPRTATRPAGTKRPAVARKPRVQAQPA